jgi:hypothetical protein
LDEKFWAGCGVGSISRLKYSKIPQQSLPEKPQNISKFSTLHSKNYKPHLPNSNSNRKNFPENILDFSEN